MATYTKSIEKLVEEFLKMPGIGPRMAERLAFYILKLPPQKAETLCLAISKVKKTTSFCKICNNLSETPNCEICENQLRDKSIICVVETPKDVGTIEKAGSFKGVYHVLHGALSPLEGVGPEDLQIQGLIARIEKDSPQEVIIATNSDTEGEATALYLGQVLKPLGVKVLRLGYGIPMGTKLEYMDFATLSKALESRKQI